MSSESESWTIGSENINTETSTEARNKALEIIGKGEFGNEIVIQESIGEASKEKCEAIINDIANLKRVETYAALIAIAYLLQQGGTSKKVNTETSVSAYGCKLTMGEMHRACAKCIEHVQNLRFLLDN